MLYCAQFHKACEMEEQWKQFWDLFEEESEDKGNKKSKDLLDVSDTEFECVTDEDKEYVKQRVSDIMEHLDKIDEEIDKASKGWSTKRMPMMDLTILRLAYYEMKMDDDIPQKVAVDQAVVMAKKYGSDDASSFVNGVLAKIF